MTQKLTGGSRSGRGARDPAVPMSVLRTARQQNRPLIDTIKTLLINDRGRKGSRPAYLCSDRLLLIPHNGAAERLTATLLGVAASSQQD